MRTSIDFSGFFVADTMRPADLVFCCLDLTHNVLHFEMGTEVNPSFFKQLLMKFFNRSNRHKNVSKPVACGFWELFTEHIEYLLSLFKNLLMRH